MFSPSTAFRLRTRRYTEEDIATTVQALHDRIADLEAENRALQETGSRALEKNVVATF
jgi:hypothetical protein